MNVSIFHKPFLLYSCLIVLCGFFSSSSLHSADDFYEESDPAGSLGEMTF